MGRGAGARRAVLGPAALVAVLGAASGDFLTSRDPLSVGPPGLHHHGAAPGADSDAGLSMPISSSGGKAAIGALGVDGGKGEVHVYQRRSSPLSLTQRGHTTWAPP